MGARAYKKDLIQWGESTGEMVDIRILLMEKRVSQVMRSLSNEYL